MTLEAVRGTPPFRRLGLSDRASPTAPGTVSHPISRGSPPYLIHPLVQVKSLRQSRNCSLERSKVSSRP